MRVAQLHGSDVSYCVRACAPWGETKQIPAVYILEQSCKQPQASTQSHTSLLMMREGGPSRVCSFCSVVSRHTVNADCDVFLPCSLLLLPRRVRGTEVWRTGEVSVSYYSLRNTSTFLFCGNTGISPGYREVHTQMLMLVSVRKDTVTIHHLITMMCCRCHWLIQIWYLLKLKFSSQLNTELWMVYSEMMIYLNLFNFFSKMSFWNQGVELFLPHAQPSSFHRNEQAPSLGLNLYFSYHIRATGT